MTGPARTFVLLLPDVRLINANDRLHRQEAARRTKAIRAAAKRQALDDLIPHLDRAHIVFEYLPPDNRRRDSANWQPSAKAAVDGLVDAGVLDDDDHTRVTGPDPRMGESAYVVTGARRPRLLLRITEVLS